MFERFSEDARQAVVFAQREARALKHNYIGTEHLLLGLLVGEGLAVRVLESLGITADEVRSQVARIVGRGDEEIEGQIPFTPRAKKVLELSLREALSLGHNWIGTEHILLGVVRENEGVASRILLDFQVDAEKIRDQIVRELSGPGRRRRRPEPGWGVRPVRRETAWEYRVDRWSADVDPELRQSLLAELGAEGWQLAAVVPVGELVDWVFQRPGRRRPPGPV